MKSPIERKWIVPVVSVVLAAVTTGVIVGYLSTLRGAVVAKPEQTEAVVFARSAIAERAIVRADALKIRMIPASAAHPQAARTIEDVAGRVAVAAIFAEEQVLLPKLAMRGASVGLSYVLAKDKRAMTIAVNEVVGVAGFVFPGDHVDVVGTVRGGGDDLNMTKIVLQNVEVLAIAQKVDQKQGEDPRVTTSATLAVTPEQAETLAQIDNNGRVRLALRPYGVTENVTTTGKTIASALGRAPAVATRPATAKPTRAAAKRPAARPVTMTPPPAPRPVVHTVDIWRSTTRTSVSVENER
jgi:pilus assembly protein CpaB